MEKAAGKFWLSPTVACPPTESLIHGAYFRSPRMAERRMFDRGDEMRTLAETQIDATIPYSAALDTAPAQPTALTTQLNDMRAAIVHHWLISRAGGERAFAAIASMLPTADGFTLFLHKPTYR